MSDKRISQGNTPIPQSVVRGADNRKDMEAQKADFQQLLFKAGFEKDQAESLASAIADAGDTVNNRLLKTVGDTQSPYRELKASWDKLKESLQDAQIGFFTRIGFAILDFFGQFFGWAKEKAQNFLLEKTVSNRQDFLQCLATLVQDLDPKKYESTPTIGEALAAKRALLLKGLVSTLSMDYPNANGTKIDQDSVVSWILDRYQLEGSKGDLESLLKEGLGLLNREANIEEPAAKTAPIENETPSEENEAPIPGQEDAQEIRSVE